MRVIMFQPQFHAAILAGTKKQTIRKTARCVPGDELSLRKWVGRPRRSKQHELLRATCTDVYSVEIRDDGIELELRPGSMPLFYGHPERWFKLDTFAVADGFADWPEMREWFLRSYGLPFCGKLITWR